MVILRPSNAHKWSRCGGSLALEARYPESEDSPEARQGTAAHWFCTEALDGRVHPVGTLAPNGEPIDAEMIEAGNIWIADVTIARVGASALHSFRVESKVYPHGLINPACEGTPDCYLVDSVQRKIIVWDYKYGHRFVDAFYNEQGACYLGGVLEGYEYTENDLAGWSLEVRVVQPRNYRLGGPVRTWNPTPVQLFAFIGHLSQRAELALLPHAPTQTGEHCRDCTGRHACDALQRSAYSACDLAGSQLPVDLAPAALGLELRIMRAAADRLAARIVGLEEQAIGLIRAGQSVPWWSLEHGQARERWAIPAPQVFALGELFGVALEKPPEPITPNQARSAGMPADALKGLTERPNGKAKLEPCDETTAARVFG